MTWDAAKPAGSQKLRLSDDEIRDNWAALEAALAAEHQFPNTGNDGQHKFPVAGATPAGLEGRVAIVNDNWYWYSNAAWRTLIPPGTKMVFLQAAAPTGWTQDASLNDKVLRLVSGAGAGTGGDWLLTGVTVAGHQLTVAEMPAHSHPLSFYAQPPGTGGSRPTGAANSNWALISNTDLTGGDGAHTHPGLDNTAGWRPAYVNVIAATKD